MYSGSDSTGSQGAYRQWPLNPSAYQNMSNEQVDWAALAQQWIIMKEAGPPPVPTQDKLKKEPPNEGGEAPMDVENDKDEPLADWSSPNSWNWNAQTQSWGWNNAWTPPTGVPPPPIPTKAPLLPTPGNYNSFNAPPESISDNANFPGYNSGPPSEFNSGYWAPGGSKQVKPHNRRFSKVNVPKPVQAVVEAQPTLDANKRKQLPAWIREGLEKMERDKQKMLEREKEKQEREEYNEKMKQSEKETMEILKTTIQEQQRSKFESDVESDEEKHQKKTHQQIELTPEEQMLNVRRTMTEILLKVTNREIEVISREELQRHLKKKKASDQRVVSAPSGANVSAKLGLGMYGGDSDSGSGGESEQENGNDKDSDIELKDSIRRKKAEFTKTEKQIEDKLLEAENRKQEAVSRTPSPETIDNDRQVDAKSQVPVVNTKRRPSNKQRHNTPSSPSSSSSSSSASRRRRHRRRSKSPRRRRRSLSRRSSYRRRRSRSRSSRRHAGRSRSSSRSSGRGKRSRRR